MHKNDKLFMQIYAKGIFDLRYQSLPKIKKGDLKVATPTTQSKKHLKSYMLIKATHNSSI